jgi:hypothetical protein
MITIPLPILNKDNFHSVIFSGIDLKSQTAFLVFYNNFFLIKDKIEKQDLITDYKAFCLFVQWLVCARQITRLPIQSHIIDVVTISVGVHGEQRGLRRWRYDAQRSSPSGGRLAAQAPEPPAIPQLG